MPSTNTWRAIAWDSELGQVELPEPSATIDETTYLLVHLRRDLSARVAAQAVESLLKELRATWHAEIATGKKRAGSRRSPFGRRS